jgi:hypothetical protein
MEEAYRAHVRQVMDAAGWHWPEHLLMDPARGPRFLSSAAELLHELQLGTHMDEVLVLPDGVEKLGGSAMDPRVQQVRVRLLLSLRLSAGLYCHPTLGRGSPVRSAVCKKSLGAGSDMSVI